MEHLLADIRSDLRLIFSEILIFFHQFCEDICIVPHRQYSATGRHGVRFQVLDINNPFPSVSKIPPARSHYHGWSRTVGRYEIVCDGCEEVTTHEILKEKELQAEQIYS